MNGPSANVLEDRIDATIESRAAGAQHQRIQVALNRPPLLDRARDIEIDHPVEADGIDWNLLDVAFEIAAGAARKSDDLRVWHRLADTGHDALHRRDAPALEFKRRQNACPGVENLHRIDTSLKLADEILN